MSEFEGVSDKSNLQEALDDAIKKAERSSSARDARISYTVKQVRGSRGGIIGENRVMVVIEAEIR